MRERKDIVLRIGFLVVLMAIAVFSGAMHKRVLHAAYSHPDEEIARAVVTKVLASKKKDTNWARTDIAETFHYNQFNFSSYYLVAAKLEKVAGHRAGDLSDPRLLLDHLREQNIYFAGFAVFLAGLLAWRIATLSAFGAAMGGLAGVAAATLTAACVTLFQDSIYARPEAFVTVLTLLYTFVLLAPKLAPAAALALAGLLLGVLVATKITFVLFLPFPLLAVIARAHSHDVEPANRLHPWRALCAIAIYLGCIAAGFCAGAPYAARAPWEYLEGVGFLMRQYSTAGWPNGLHDGGMIARLMHGLSYLAYTDGLVVLVLAAVAIAVLLRTARHAVVLAVAGPLLTLVYFLQTRAFFERNFSHALPVLFALAAVGLCLVVAWVAERFGKTQFTSRAIAIAGAAVGVALAVYVPAAISKRLYDVILDTGADSRVDAAMNKVDDGGHIPVINVYSNIAEVADMRSGLCGRVVYKMYEYGDTYSKNVIVDLVSRGYAILAELRGPFDGAPISTLQTYHATNVIFLASPPDDVAACKAELFAPTPDPAYRKVDADVKLSQNWTLGGFPSDMSLHGWAYPFFASWNGDDSKTGDMSIGPFEACGDVVVPFAVGPIRTGTELVIERTFGDMHETIVDGPPPQAVTWTAIRIHAAPVCATYSIRARDSGAGYGEWIGVGLPVELRTSDSPLPAASTPAAAAPPKPTPPAERCGRKNCG